MKRTFQYAFDDSILKFATIVNKKSKLSVAHEVKLFNTHISLVALPQRMEVA